MLLLVGSLSCGRVAVRRTISRLDEVWMCFVQRLSELDLGGRHQRAPRMTRSGSKGRNWS